MAAENRLSAALTGRYEVEREIGAGGMATVYLARDVKHNRRVALKVLKAELGAVLGVERFLSEIQVTANLQHPNLLPLFDSGEADGLLFYVMPFVEGESLRARLDREKQLPIDEAVRIATAIAAALDYAHGNGVIHRDLKPENILLQVGQPVIADFGIALAVSNAGGARVTQTGLSLGTPQYMSPEQATGDRVIDARSDIYSLGAVTYEMLVGDPPHLGSTAQAIIAKVLTERPASVRVARPMVSERVALAVERSLEKLPADRWTTAGEFADALHGKISTAEVRAHLRPVGASEPVGAPRWMRWGLVATTLIAVAGIAATTWLATRPVARPPAARFTLGLPDSVSVFIGGGTKLAIARDGRSILIVGVRNGRRGIYLRRLDQPVVELVRGTEARETRANVSPRLSPEGDWILYQDEAALKKVPVTGGTPVTVADSASSSSWGEGGVLVYVRNRALWIASAEGRDGRLLASPDTARGIWRFVWPDILPGGSHALVVLDRSPTVLVVDSLHLGVVSLADGSVTELGLAGTNPTYVASGQIVFGRAGGLVFAAPFSLRKLAVTGPPRLLLEGVWQGSGGATGYAVSNNGTLVYHGGGFLTSFGDMNLIVADQTGSERIVPGGTVAAMLPRVSPDGKHVAFATRLGTGQLQDVSLIELATGARQRVAEQPVNANIHWMGDGSRIVFLRDVGLAREVVSRSWDRGAADLVLLRDSTRTVSAFVPGVSRGFAALSFGSTRTREGGLYLSPMDSIGRLRPFVATPANETHARISPDGRWMAYSSNESGTFEVYVQPVPGPGPRVQASVGGGTEPIWARDNATLYYRGQGWIRSARLGGVPQQVLRRDSLFADSFNSTNPGSSWDVFPSGREFLFLRSPSASAVINDLFVIVNWPQLDALRERTGEPER